MRPLLLLLLLLLRRTPYKQGTDFMERDSIKPIVFPQKERQNNTMILLDSNSKKNRPATTYLLLLKYQTNQPTESE
jgi:hypothetical protein